MSRVTRGTCSNIGGYYAESASSTETTTRSYFSHALATNVCYIHNYYCPGHSYNGQCYSGRSSLMSCSTCKNIGGDFIADSGCYYYSNNCTYLSAGSQCHTHRSVTKRQLSVDHYNHLWPTLINIIL